MDLTYALISQNYLLHTLFSDSRAGNFSLKLEQGLKEKIYSIYPQYKNNLEMEVLLTVLIQGGFRASIFHSENENDTEKVSEILGKISQVIRDNFFLTAPIQTS